MGNESEEGVEDRCGVVSPSVVNWPFHSLLIHCMHTFLFECANEQIRLLTTARN
jgi:hypothetical protein